ncbi:Transcriptional regulator, DeoR family OS=Tsukamurella paurometabola (strain ATCC 8368 / DSM/ CCUG 35730 / CIP 100753 / JCM 10117 / KCTC 9821 / NBRC 16120/ NCIMB 702349 / NCTC 13040) OX=521096 GN=Tpau_0184 PE=4 SV=1 [Tsukamurella paurometabola]|uniref:Lactose phosphotransferase system repressor n=1 Tax=Tsukamurella paurometabola (strain ATCC 8368 / DSM 20162 / CCUG 35730 / CIP 100753 / JCM 10117 / KCTC 9821 / NBRC 16120 / NCIMB 702349 / NCTC 13040) TaxID=521096 RepID=D5UQK5_TSUPD|nr:DeoR/GlpR family DNA-binding transcription regulator [Tsukamurella paurometabola]ADG76838.1 transcriptional regulator, DeoR family [Tsukamurella paurometabola DSM 20162]SUP41855.1 Glycerol-3-phosphate regulon repressor [Tsukamurella paurometabola]
MYAEERQRAISDLVAARGRASVTELAERYDVTPETVRRDLDALERLGGVRRVHGGVVAAGVLAGAESGVGEREVLSAEAKRAIGEAARAFLPPAGGSVLFDAGTTTIAAAREIPAGHRLAAVTNSLAVATTLAGRDGVELRMLGGRIRGLTQAAVGAGTVAEIAGLHADVAFLGTNGLSARRGLSTPDAEEAAVKSALLNAADVVVLLADASKFDHESLVSVGALDRIDALVTDVAPVGELGAALAEHDVTVVVAP